MNAQLQETPPGIFLQPGAVYHAYCVSCNVQHPIHFKAGHYQEWLDFANGHKGHFVVKLSNEDWWKYSQPKSNANIKIANAASAAYTITLASLATSSTWTVGRESTGVSNTTNLYLDYIIGGKITVGTTPTANTSIEVWAIPSVNDTPTYPDVFDGTDSAETVTTRSILLANGHLLAALVCEAATSDVAHWMRATSLIQTMGAVSPPAAHSLFVTHNTAVNFNSTGGNHVLNSTGVYATVV